MVAYVVCHGNYGEHGGNSHGNTGRGGFVVNPKRHPAQDDDENAREEVT